jgi:hypothetical protein
LLGLALLVRVSSVMLATVIKISSARFKALSAAL